MDALLWASGFLIGVFLHQGGLSRPDRPITVLVRGSDLGTSGEVLLAQARSLGLHICVWADKALERTGWLEGLMANTHRVLEDIGDGTAQVLMGRSDRGRPGTEDHGPGYGRL